jgi:hypothetical protein
MQWPYNHHNLMPGPTCYNVLFVVIMKNLMPWLKLVEVEVEAAADTVTV